MEEETTDMKERFYKVEANSTVGSAIREFWEELDAKVDAIKPWVMECFGKEVNYYHNSNLAHSFTVVGFGEQLPGLKKHKSWSCYVPDLRKKEGKRIQQALEQFNHKRMESVLCPFGFSYMYYGENSPNGHGTVIRWVSFTREHEGHFYVKRPFGGGSDEKRVPPLHSDLVEIKKSEFIKAEEEREEALEKTT